jgi:hypothetical protein
MITEEFKNIVNERFLEVTDKFPEMIPKVYERGNYVYLSLEIIFKNSAVRHRLINQMKYDDMTPLLLQEIIDNCEFVKDYFSLVSFEIQSITFSRNQFLYTAKYRKQ